MLEPKYTTQLRVRLEGAESHYATVTRGDDFRASEDEVQAALADLAAARTRIAASIANGHAFAKHAAQFGVTTSGAFQSVVEATF